MKRLFKGLLLVCTLLLFSGLTSGCAKEGCPANQALYNESMGNDAASKKKSKAPKSSSGLFPEGKDSKKNW